MKGKCSYANRVWDYTKSRKITLIPLLLSKYFIQFNIAVSDIRIKQDSIRDRRFRDRIDLSYIQVLRSLLEQQYAHVSLLRTLLYSFGCKNRFEE